MPTLAEKKTLLIGIGVGVATLFSTFVLLKFPLSSHILQLFPAIAAGLIAVSLVLIYRTVRIINFAQTALGVVAAQLFYELYTRSLLPYPLAVLSGVLGGTIVATVMGIIMATLFFRHPRLVLTVVTVFIVSIVGFASEQINNIFVRPGEVRPPQPIVGPWSGSTTTIDGVPFRPVHFIGLFLLVSIAAGLTLFFRRSRVGIAIRASAENSDRASLLGINVKLLNVGVWALVGAIASLATIAAMPVDAFIPGQGAGAERGFGGMFLPLAAAVVGRMSSMPIAFFAGAGVTLLKGAVIYKYSSTPLIDLGLFAILMASLLLQKKKIQSRAEETSSWRGVKEVRPTPKEMLALPFIRRMRLGLFLFFGLVVLGFPWIVSATMTESFTFVWVSSLIGISLVILTGWSGQISFGQIALVAAGAFIGGNATLNWGLPFWIALPIAGLGASVFAVIIGLPALRIRGLFLAVTTFAVAIVLPQFLFDDKFLGKWTPTQDLERPTLPFFDFRDSRSMYYLAFIMFMLVALAVTALRKSRGGRILIAMRDNEAGVQSFGVDLVKTRLSAFALSGFIAGFGGCLFAHAQGGMDFTFYNVQFGVNMFILVVLGGVSSILGAFLGSLYFVGGGLLFPGLLNLLTGLAGLAFLMAIPGGLTQIVFGARDAVLRVIALRQHIIVPSLFQDYSPEAWEKRLAPLAPAVQTQGLAVLDPEQRYALKSQVFGGASA